MGATWGLSQRCARFAGQVMRGGFVVLAIDDVFAKIRPMSMIRVVVAAVAGALLLSCNPQSPRFAFTSAERRGVIETNGLRFVIMPDTTMARAYQVGERLRVSIAADAFPVKPGLGIHLTASVGLATLESPDDTPETVFRRADSALFAAKRRGRNRVAANAA